MVFSFGHDTAGCSQGPQQTLFTPRVWPICSQKYNPRFRVVILTRSNSHHLRVFLHTRAWHCTPTLHPNIPCPLPACNLYSEKHNHHGVSYRTDHHQVAGVTFLTCMVLGPILPVRKDESDVWGARSRYLSTLHALVTCGSCIVYLATQPLGLWDPREMIFGPPGERGVCSYLGIPVAA